MSRLESLRSMQPFAIVDIKGFQEKVEKGMKLRVPTIAGEPGATVTFEKVLLLVKGDDDIHIGKPTVSGTSVEATILSHGRGEKIRVFKMRRRKRYRRLKGHRQRYTEIEVTGITAP